MSLSPGYVLLHYGSDPFDFHFKDLDGRRAFTVDIAHQNPTVVRVTRESPWSQQHQDIMGPSSAFLYLGPENTRGSMAYGNGDVVSMANHLRQRRDGSSSRHFTTQTGKELKWKVSPHKMECFDKHTMTIAVWEQSPSGHEFFAHLHLHPSALSFVTELLTTLALNRMALALDW